MVLFGLVPSPPCGVGPVVLLVGPVPPATEVWYGCCRLLVVTSSYVPCLLPPCGGACGLFWLALPFTEVWYGCCRLLVVMSSLLARYHTTKFDVARFSLQMVPLSLLRCGSPLCEAALAGIILHLPPSGLRLWDLWEWFRAAGLACAQGPCSSDRGEGRDQTPRGKSPIVP